MSSPRSHSKLDLTPSTSLSLEKALPVSASSLKILAGSSTMMCKEPSQRGTTMFIASARQSWSQRGVEDQAHNCIVLASWPLSELALKVMSLRESMGDTESCSNTSCTALQTMLVKQPTP